MNAALYVHATVMDVLRPCLALDHDAHVGHDVQEVSHQQGLEVALLVAVGVIAQREALRRVVLDFTKVVLVSWVLKGKREKWFI